MPKILVVCSANVCRSPVAATIIQDILARSAPTWEVDSAGIRPSEGAPICGHAKASLRSSGLAESTDRHHSKLITKAMIESADIILTADLDVRAVVAVLAPDASQRTFTLREAVELSALEDSSPVLLRGSLRSPGGIADIAWRWHAGRPLLAPVLVYNRRPMSKHSTVPTGPNRLDIVDAHQSRRVSHGDTLTGTVEAAKVIARSIAARSQAITTAHHGVLAHAQ